MPGRQNPTIDWRAYREVRARCIELEGDGQPQAAVGLLERHLRDYPRDLRALKLLSDLLVRLDRRAEAAALVARDAEIRAEAGFERQASLVLHRAVRIHPEAAGYYLLRRAELLARVDFALAAPWFKRALAAFEAGQDARPAP